MQEIKRSKSNNILLKQKPKPLNKSQEKPLRKFNPMATKSTVSKKSVVPRKKEDGMEGQIMQILHDNFLKDFAQIYEEENNKINSKINENTHRIELIFQKLKEDKVCTPQKLSAFKEEGNYSSNPRRTQFKEDKQKFQSNQKNCRCTEIEASLSQLRREFESFKEASYKKLNKLIEKNRELQEKLKECQRPNLFDDIFDNEKGKDTVEVYLSESNCLLQKGKENFEPLITDTGNKVVITAEQKKFIEQQQVINGGVRND